MSVPVLGKYDLRRGEPIPPTMKKIHAEYGDLRDFVGGLEKFECGCVTAISGFCVVTVVWCGNGSHADQVLRTASDAAAELIERALRYMSRQETRAKLGLPCGDGVRLDLFLDRNPS